MISWGAPSLLDRAEDRRGDADWVAAQWELPQATVLPVSTEGGVAWADDRPGYRPATGPLTDRHLLLGLLRGSPVFAEVAAGPADVQALRSVMDGLSAADLEIAFTAATLVSWHERTRFCGSCGGATALARAGLARTCPACDQELYPRVDPAVIVAVTDARDRLLLGRQPVWPPGRMSVFAGFVEAGESLEQTVHREVFEEVGLRLTDVRYLGSQPWPFPRSLMVGFAAHASDTALVIDPTEIEQARWFSRDELAAALASGEVALPMTTSIAHRMITHWQAEGLAPAPDGR